MQNFLILFILISSNFLYSQNTPPPGYNTSNIVVGLKNHCYFNFKTGVSKSVLQSGWDIAVYNEAHEIGGKVNDAVGTRVWRVYKDTSSFASVTIADTIFPVYNNDTFMYLGALDTIYTGSFANVFYIGLGKLNPGPFNAEGDKVYIIKKEDGTYGKFFLVNYDKVNNFRKFTFKYSDIDNSNSKYISINKQDIVNNHYQYLNFSTGVSNSSFENTAYNDWDLVFKPYDVLTSNIPLRMPIGVLSNNSFNLIRVSNIPGLPANYLKDPHTSTTGYEAGGVPTAVVYNSSLDINDTTNKNMNHIGAKWYDATSLNAKKDVSYFIKSSDGCIYHIVFTSFNPNTNSVDFAYKLVKCVSNGISNSIKKENEILILNQENELMIENAENELFNSLVIYDITGKILYNQNNLKLSQLKIDKSILKSNLIFIYVSTKTLNFHSKIKLD